MSQERGDSVTQNMLVLELSTMVVAIALALNSEGLTRVDVFTIMGFAAMNILVIWFWWFYVVDRLTFPLRSMTFPLKDVILLLLITLIPFIMRSRSSVYVNGLFGFIFLVWAWLAWEFRGHVEEGGLDEGRARALSLAVRRMFTSRLASGVIFLLGALVGYFSNHLGFAYFTAAAAEAIVVGTIRSARREARLRRLLRGAGQSGRA